MKIQLVTLSQFEKNQQLSNSTYVAFTHKKNNEASWAAPRDLQKLLGGQMEKKAISADGSEASLYRGMSFLGSEHVAVVGLGTKSENTNENYRQIGAAVEQVIASSKSSIASINWDEIAVDKKNNANYLEAFCEGLILSSYKFDELKSKTPAKAGAAKTAATEKKETTFLIITEKAATAELKKAVETAHIIAETVNFSRRLGDLPGNLMTPTMLAKAAVDAVKGTGVKATVWDKARIKKERMGGLLGVAQGSDQEPKFIILEYKGAAASKKPVVFVGKGLTFDCGGISIKPSAAMEEMKYDMCGGANVIGTLVAIAKLKLKINAIALVPTTENLAGPSATKPGDVHTARNGKTFEVNNTDAEGRLILADALSYASELNPEVIFDAATLTGAIIVALGNIHTGYFTRNQAVKAKVEKAAQESGELVWNLPLTDFHLKDMKGTFADLSNISSGKGAGSATAAAFLEQFVGKDIPWVHFDIAGTGWAVGNRLNYCPKKGASGAMIRTFAKLAQQYV